jgi:hypothetical protein
MTFKDKRTHKKHSLRTQIRKTTKKEPLFTGIKCHEALVLVHEETNQNCFDTRPSG